MFSKFSPRVVFRSVENLQDCCNIHCLNVTKTPASLKQVSGVNNVRYLSTSNYKLSKAAIFGAGSKYFNSNGSSFGEEQFLNINKDNLPGLIIFDKDGTLIDLRNTHPPWIDNIIQKLEAITKLKLREVIASQLDLCYFTNKPKNGVLAHGTSWQIKRELEDVLFEAGCSRQYAEKLVEECWVEKKITSQKTVTDLTDMFKLFKMCGVKVAVCTSDNRYITENTLNYLGLSEYVDATLCADDGQFKIKSSGKNVHHLCRLLDVPAENTVVIGDTFADLKMGIEANVGMTVGVLSGACNRLELSPMSDVILDDVSQLINLLFKQDVWLKKKELHTRGLKVRRIGKVNTSGKKASLAIFDKDGTLICFHSMWTPWAENLVKNLEKETGLKLRHKVLQELGYCHDKQKWTPGIMAEGTTEQNKCKILETLITEGLKPDEANEVVKKSWVDGDHSNTKFLKTLDNPESIFHSLKNAGIKIAICTADSRAATEQFVKSVGLSDVVDMLVCGDDHDNMPKPAPHGALKICKALNIDLEETVVIGDTIADMGMGKSAKLGATIGVLSGVGDVTDLDEADHIVPSIKHILPIVLDDLHL